MADIKTITLNGAEQTVKISGQNCSIMNRGSAAVYASAKSGVVADADGVLTIPAGTEALLLDSRGSVSLLGSGKVSLCGTDYARLIFSASGGSGGSDNSGTLPDGYDVATDEEVSDLFPTDTASETLPDTDGYGVPDGYEIATDDEVGDIFQI